MGIGLLRVTRAQILGVSISTLLVVPVHAHNNRAELAFYGGFGPAATRCQRIIAKATEQCAVAAVAARSLCMADQIGGQPCDSGATDAAAQVARQRARDLIQGACTEQDAQALQFSSIEEAQLDATAACGDAETAAASATYGPVMLGGTVGSAQGTVRACTTAAAREGERLMQVTTRARRRMFDRVVANELSPSAKQVLAERTARRIHAAHSAAVGRLTAVCRAADFTQIYARSPAAFLESMEQRGNCIASAAYVQAEVTCPPSVCGNGMQEDGEACDDGNDYDSDGCHNDCTKNDCQLFSSTYELIQTAIFENRGCTNDLCHGSGRQGGLDLRRGTSYGSLVDVTSTASTLKRVEPGDQDKSLLWLKLAAATLRTTGVPGSPMPQGLPPLSEAELEAVRLWIYSGAPPRGVVRGTGERLDACLPRPEPIEIRPPAPPDPGSGVQLHMAAWVLPGHSESEVCFAAYYDLSDQVPAQFRSADGTKLRYYRQVTTQNPLSHHLVTQFYEGQFPPDDPTWGTYACLAGVRNGEACSPTEIGACGAGSECSTVPVKSIACIGFGPPDAQVDINNLGFGGAQETVADVSYPAGVYAEIPIKGVIRWNSHAFNLADSAGKIEAWVNFSFAPPENQRYPARDIVAVDEVFGMQVPPYSTQEICNDYAMEFGAQLVSISSHMHQRGKRFRIFRGGFRCDGGANAGRSCSPLSPELCPAASCAESTGRDGAASLMYTNLVYNDPVVLRFEPPLDFSGDTPDRTLTYCAVYDNGATDPTRVKRKSLAPPPPLSGPGFGGACTTPTACVSGKPGQPCSGRNQTQRDASCDSAAGVGDGFCDACTLTGGVTTDDEMFVLLGSFYVP